MKFTHTFPIRDPRRGTPALIRDANVQLCKVTPEGVRLERHEWHRRSRELILVCDAVPTARVLWHRDGMVLRAAAVRDRSEAA